MRMMNNKKGQQIFVGIMAGIMVFIALTQLIVPLKGVVSDSRTSMNCGNSSLTTGDKASCVLLDWYIPYFLAAGIAGTVAFITMRKYVQVSQ